MGSINRPNSFIRLFDLNEDKNPVNQTDLFELDLQEENFEIDSDNELTGGNTGACPTMYHTCRTCKACRD